MTGLLIVSLGTVAAGILAFVIRLFLGAAACMVFVCALAAGGFAHFLKDLLKSVSVIKNGVSARAERREQKSYLKHEAVYVYTADDGKVYWYTKEFTVLNPLFYSKPEITVFYMPDDPHRSVCKADAALKIINLVCYLALAAPVISVFAVLMFV